MQPSALKPIVLWIAAFCALASGRCLAQERVQESVSRETAWQADEKLGEQWEQMTGRFIFQRVCLDCHTGGPGEYARQEWERMLEDFPTDDHPELSDVYKDLTALFTSRRMVPNEWSRRNALETFILKNAPEEAGEPGGEVDLFPMVGDKAPDFTIEDVNGVELSLESFKGKRNVLVVFSRADW